VPGAGVLLQDSLLLHARALIEFYLPDNPFDTNIVHNDFGLPAPGATIQSQLKRYRRPIEVHLGHLTAWRDVDYRQAHASTTYGRERQRSDWNIQNPKIVSLIFDALDEVSRPNGSWSQPFRELHTASLAALKDPSTDWPTHLTEKMDVEQYVQGLGL
jgi:hypothetical protein